MLIVYLILLNLMTYLLFAYDKQQAKRRGRRIPERTLLIFAAFGGSPGALLAMYTCRHKTRKWKFRAGIPILLAVQAAGVIWICLQTV